MTESEVRQEFRVFEDAGAHPDLLHIRYGKDGEVEKAAIKRGDEVLFSYPDRFRHHADDVAWRHFSCQPTV